MSETKLKCSERVSLSGLWATAPCSKPVKVHRNGKPYCTIHDPERVKARREARNKVYDEKFEQQLRLIDKTAARSAIATAAIEVVNAMDAVARASVCEQRAAGDLANAANKPILYDPWGSVIAAVRKWEKLP